MNLARKLAILRAPRLPRETVEQFLARGGEIEHAPMGVGGRCQKCRRVTGSDLQMVASRGLCVECYGAYMQRVHGAKS